MISWLNGSLKLAHECHISINDRGFLIGDGLFETLFYNGQELECFKAHYRRLIKGLALFQIPWNYSEYQLEAIIFDLIQANQLNRQTAAIRVTVTRGKGERGLAIPDNSHPTLLIQCSSYKREDKLLKLAISKHCHPGPSALTAVKHLGYQFSILGRIEAKEKGGVDDVIFLNYKEEVVCSTAGNVFALIDGAYITPPLNSGCLPGIKRGQIIQAFKASGKPLYVRPISKLDLFYKAESIFLTNSLINKKWVESMEEANYNGSTVKFVKKIL